MSSLYILTDIDDHISASEIDRVDMMENVSYYCDVHMVEMDMVDSHFSPIKKSFVQKTTTILYRIITARHDAIAHPVLPCGHRIAAIASIKVNYN